MLGHTAVYRACVRAATVAWCTEDCKRGQTCRPHASFDEGGRRVDEEVLELQLKPAPVYSSVPGEYLDGARGRKGW